MAICSKNHVKTLLHWKKTLKTYTPTTSEEYKMLMFCPLATQATEVHTGYKSLILHSSRKNAAEVLQVYSYCTKSKEII